jgi:TonB family protein
MLRTNDEQLKNLRNPERPDQSTGIARPPRASHALFAGWGPKLLTAAITLAAALCSSQPASAATKVIAMASCAADHGAVLLSHPDVILPDFVSGTGETVLRVDLVGSGQISNIAIAQSSGDAALDFAAMHVARGSRYEPASSDCQASGDSVLYRVIFDQ